MIDIRDHGGIFEGKKLNNVASYSDVVQYGTNTQVNQITKNGDIYGCANIGFYHKIKDGTLVKTRPYSSDLVGWGEFGYIKYDSSTGFISHYSHDDVLIKQINKSVITIPKDYSFHAISKVTIIDGDWFIVYARYYHPAYAYYQTCITITQSGTVIQEFGISSGPSLRGALTLTPNSNVLFAMANGGTSEGYERVALYGMLASLNAAKSIDNINYYPGSSNGLGSSAIHTGLIKIALAFTMPKI